MLRRLLSFHLLMSIFLSSFFVLHSQTVISPKEILSHSGSCAASIQSTPLDHSIVDINNLWLKVQNDGRIGYDTLRGKGLSYPQQSGNLLHCDNLIWVGKIDDGQLPILRAGGGRYISGTVPGGILSKGTAEDPQSSSVRVYRIRADYRTADLTLDAAGQYGVDKANVTVDMVAAVRAQYEKDWKEWPWQKGAPFEDKNRDGVMDADEVPGLQSADQVVWFSYNDLDESVSRSFAGSSPIGIEVQVTLWAYKDIPALQDIIFKRYRLVYKGTSLTPATASIDSMYLTQWSDPDIEGSSEDLGGCDSTMSMAFAYRSAIHRSGSDPGMCPGVAYQVVQGPLVQGGTTDRGLFDFVDQPGKKNLPLTSCVFHLPGWGDVQSPGPVGPNSSFFYWNVARGMRDFGTGTVSATPWLDQDRRPTEFMYAGDPVTGTGWLCKMGTFPWYGNDLASGGDVSVYMASGPFSMVLGDAQEIVLALMVCPAGDGVGRVSYLKYMEQTLKGIWPSIGEYVAYYRGLATNVERSVTPGVFALEQNYPNPFNPSTQIKYSISHESNIKLVIVDLLGREVRLLRTGSQPAGNHTVHWDGCDDKGVSVKSGVYFCTLSADKFRLTRKLLLLR